MSDEDILTSLAEPPPCSHGGAFIPHWLYLDGDKQWRLTGPKTRRHYLGGTIPEDQVRRLSLKGLIVANHSSAVFELPAIAMEAAKPARQRRLARPKATARAEGIAQKGSSNG